MVEDWLRAVTEAAPLDPRDGETGSEYLRRVGRHVDAPERAAAAVDAYRTATFGPTADLEEGQRAALEGFLAAVETAEGARETPEGEAADGPVDTVPATGGEPDEPPVEPAADAAEPGGDADGSATEPAPGRRRGAADAAGAAAGHPATDTATPSADEGTAERPPPGRGLEPPVTVPDQEPRAAGPASLPDAVGERHRLPDVRLGEAVALLAVVLFFGALGVAAAGAGPAPATERPLAVGVQGGFGGSTGYVTTTGGDWRSESMAGGFDVEWVGGERVLATVLERGREDCGRVTPPCARAGIRVYDTGEDTVVRTWTRPVANDTAPPVLAATMLDDGTVVLADPAPDRGGLIAVGPAGEVAWRWNLTAHYGTGPGAPAPARLSVTDVDHPGQDRYLVTVAVTDQVLVLERGVGVVDVVNEHRNESLLDGPHDAERLGRGRLLVADSRHNRVVVLVRGARGWHPAWTLTAAGGTHLSLPRDVDPLPGGTLLVSDSLHDRVVQVSRDGAVYRTWDLPVPYAADARASRVPGDGWAPAAGPATPRVAVLSAVYIEARSTVGLPYWVDQWLFAGGVAALVVALVGLGQAARSRRGA